MALEFWNGKEELAYRCFEEVIVFECESRPSWLGKWQCWQHKVDNFYIISIGCQQVLDVFTQVFKIPLALWYLIVLILWLGNQFLKKVIYLTCPSSQTTGNLYYDYDWHQRPFSFLIPIHSTSLIIFVVILESFVHVRFYTQHLYNFMSHYFSLSQLLNETILWKILALSFLYPVFNSYPTFN